MFSLLALCLTLRMGVTEPFLFMLLLNLFVGNDDDENNTFVSVYTDPNTAPVVYFSIYGIGLQFHKDDRQGL